MKKIRKSFGVILTAAVFLSTLTACTDGNGQNLKAKETLKIGVANRTFKENVYRYMEEGSQARAEQLHAEIRWQACDMNIATQMNIVENYIAQDYDCIAIEPCDTVTVYQTARRVQKEGIPLIALDQKMEGIVPDLYITADNYKLGSMQVEDFISRWGEEPANCVVLTGPDGEYGAEQIKSGVVDTIAKYENLNLIFIQAIADWDREKAMKSMEDAISVYGEEIDVVFAANDGMMLGAYKAAENSGLENKMEFYGGDDDKETVEMILAGADNLHTVERNSYQNGEIIAEAAYELMTGAEVTYDEIDEDGYKVRWVELEMVSADEMDPAREKFPELFE